MTDFKMIPVDKIQPDPNQPRKIYDETAMSELVASVKEKGILQPILLRPNGSPSTYLLVCGERRYRASKEAGLTEVPAVIRELSDDEALELQIIENLQRKDVHPMEEAVAFKSLLENKTRPLTIDEIAAKIGKSAYFVKQRLKLNALSQEWQAVFYQNKLSPLQAIHVSQLSPELQKDLFKDKAYGDWKTNPHYRFNISDWDIERRQMKLNNAPFDKKDETLNPKMGACNNCPFNSAVACLFPDDAKDPVCNNPGCYNVKVDNSFQRKLKEVSEDPAIVLVDNEYYRYGKDDRLEKLIKAGYKIYSLSKKEFTRVSTSDKSYKDGLKTGKVLKAFVVAGDQTGKHIYVSLGKPKATSNKVDPQTAGVEDITSEITRIKDREKRAKELDCEKIWTKVRTLIPEHRNSIFNSAPLSQVEMEAFANALEDKISFSNSEWIDEQFDKKEGFNGITELGLNVLARIFMMDVLPTAYGSHLGDSASGNHHAYLVLKQYLPEQINRIELEQEETAAKRADRVAKRIKALQTQKKDLQKPTAQNPSDKNSKPKKVNK